MINRIFKVLFFISLIFTVNSCTQGGSVIDPPDTGETATQFSESAAFEDIIQFRKNVLVLEFVSFDCVYCPIVAKQIEAAKETYPGRIDLIRVHGRLYEKDPMVFPGYERLEGAFIGINGYPACVTDLTNASVTVGKFDVSDKSFTDRLHASVDVGIALNATIVNDNTVSLKVEVGNKGTTVDDYYLAVAVLENRIIGKQADIVNNETYWIENYEHSRVLRAFLSENYFGDAIGVLQQNSIYSKTFSYVVPEEYKKENLSFITFVVRTKTSQGRVSLNSRSVGIGKSAGFSGTVK